MHRIVNIHPAPRFLARRYVELLTGMAVLFVLQTGLVPFHFTSGPAALGGRTFFSLHVSHVTIPDVAANIFLYVPVGLLIHASLRRRRRRAAPFLTTLLFAGGLSAGVEWLQAYSPERVSSLFDLAGNVTGAAMGASLSAVGCRLLQHALAAALFEAHQRPQALFVKGYVLLLVICSAVPFSFSLDAGRIRQAVRNAVVVPFGGLSIEREQAAKAIAGGDQLAFERFRWQSMKHGSHWAAEAASFLLLAWLIHWILRGDYRFGRGATAGLIAYLGGLLAVGLSMLQFFIVSRGFDVTDILFRLAGLTAGLATKSIVFTDCDEAFQRGTIRRRVANLGFVAVVAYIFYNGLIPLSFRWDAHGPAVFHAPETTLPFFAHFLARFDLMMTDVMEKFVGYAMFAGLLILRDASSADRRGRLLRVTAVGVTIAALIEVAQLFLAVRTPGVTDLILAAGGCLAGAVTAQKAAAFDRLARSGDLYAPAALPPSLEPAGSLTSIDALIASLTEPSPTSPREPSPRPASRPSPDTRKE